MCEMTDHSGMIFARNDMWRKAPCTVSFVSSFIRTITASPARARGDLLLGELTNGRSDSDGRWMAWPGSGGSGGGGGCPFDSSSSSIEGFVVITVRLRCEAGCNDDDHTFAISFAQIPYS